MGHLPTPDMCQFHLHNGFTFEAAGFIFRGAIYCNRIILSKDHGIPLKIKRNRPDLMSEESSSHHQSRFSMMEPTIFVDDTPLGNPRVEMLKRWTPGKYVYTILKSPLSWSVLWNIKFLFFQKYWVSNRPDEQIFVSEGWLNWPNQYLFHHLFRTRSPGIFQRWKREKCHAYSDSLMVHLGFSHGPGCQECQGDLSWASGIGNYQEW